MNDTIKNLYELFDAAWEINMSGNGTDITRMVTTFVPDAIQDLQAYEDMFKNMERHKIEKIIDKLEMVKTDLTKTQAERNLHLNANNTEYLFNILIDWIKGL